MIRFSAYKILYLILSGIVIIPGIWALSSGGIRPAIDFTGGTIIEIKSNTILPESLIDEAVASASAEVVGIMRSGENTTIRTKTLFEEQSRRFESILLTHEGSTIERRETVGPVLGKELLEKTVIAAIFAVIGILLYVAYAFRNFSFGISAVGALIHDSLVMFGVFALLGKYFSVEVDTLFVTAFMTTMSFSVHDTIVIFDRIREYRKKDAKASFVEISDIALTETMGRSLVNSFTIIFMLLALVLMGGETVKWFAVALLVGTITGTYSSPFIATPILLFLEKMKKK
jgi:preprotein translocase subunit SecF